MPVCSYPGISYPSSDDRLRAFRVPRNPLCLFEAEGWVTLTGGPNPLMLNNKRMAGGWG